MINSKFKVKKLLKIIGQILFYSIGMLLIFLIFSNRDIELKEIAKSFLPITYNSYWFMTIYVIIYLLSNYINKFLKTLNKKEYIMLILLLVTIWSILPTFILGKIEYSNIDWFILLYMIGAYVRLYASKFLNENKKISIILSILILIGAISVFILDKAYNILKLNPLHFTAPLNQIIVLGVSVCLFLIFKNMNIKENKIINKIASCTLGVYLIHTNIFTRDVIWHDIFNITKFSSSKYLVLYEIFTIATVYIICILIDYIRQLTIEKLYIKLINKFEIFYHTKYKKKIKLLQEKNV